VSSTPLGCRERPAWLLSHNPIHEVGSRSQISAIGRHSRAPVRPGRDFHPLAPANVQCPTWSDGRRIAHAQHG